MGQAIHPQGFANHLHPDDCLGDLAEVFAGNRRTAVGITTEEGFALGMATVNDVMRAYFEGVPIDTKLREWMRGAATRAPESLLRHLEVRPSTLLSEVAAKMVSNVVRGDCASHHVLVTTEGGQLHGVVSSHDLVEAFRFHDMWNHLPQDFEANENVAVAQPDAEQQVAHLFVRDIMKPRDHVYACDATVTLKSALRTLLVTQQNFLLVVGPTGIFGFLSARDMVKAFADALSLDTTVSEFLKSQPPEKTHRTIMSHELVIDAAEEMTNHEVDHLVVIRSEDSEAVGVVSSLDLVLHTKARDFVLEMPAYDGPSVGEVLHEHTAMTTMCDFETTLGLLCARLLAAGQTSAFVGKASDARPRFLFTESDIVRCFANRYNRDVVVGDMIGLLGEHKVPNYLQVPPSMRLLQAGALMLQGAQPGRSCHHLVVRAVTDSAWLGVFSALDIARALHHLSSRLDAARLNVDGLIVDSVMKPVEAVPTCSTSGTLRDVLGQLLQSGQTAAVVMDGETSLGLITHRCAVHGFAAGVSPCITIGEWMRARQLPEGPREVLSRTSIVEAATLMLEHKLHHLVVVEYFGGATVGVVSALDIVRGVVSVHQECPFVTLSWLRRLGVPLTFAPQARALRPRKHFLFPEDCEDEEEGQPEGQPEGPPATKVRRTIACA